MHIFAVSEITRYLKDLLDSQETLRDLWVVGEVSNLARAPSGHVYFTVKDGTSQLACVLWRSQAQRLAALPQEGMRVILHGYITVYEARGVYQFYADLVQPEGIGLLHMQFEELKARLEAEGLFDSAHKRPLPAHPQRIGVVTSPVGAVIHDILNILRRRYPIAQVVLAPSAVQGPEAPAQIVAALHALQQFANVDVIIVARGGGSLEELWAFNDEAVARAIYGCRVPVVSGVGHEVDVTIADYVADVRAPTPSAAAELVAPDQQDLRREIASWMAHLGQLAQGYLTQARNRLAAEERALRSLSPQAMIAQQRQRLDDLWRRAYSVLLHDLGMRRERLRSARLHMQALSPLAVLERGFAIVRRWADGAVVSRVGQVTHGDALQVRVSDGSFAAVVEDHRQRPRRRSKQRADNGQLPLLLRG